MRHYEVVKYTCNLSYEKREKGEHGSLKKIKLETIMSEIFPNVSKTVNPQIKKPINLKQKKYRENH